MTDRLRRRVVLVLVGLAAAVVLAVVGLAGEHSPAGGREAPQLPREALLGGPLTVDTLVASAHGRAALVVFWASWCGPCAREAPAIERFATSPAGRGRIVGVDWSDGLSGARAFLRHHRWSFTNLRDGEGTVGYAYHLTVLPTTFVLNSHGHIAATLPGPQTQNSLEHALARVERS